MKSIVFDSGPIISLAMNNLLWLLDPLKQKFKGEFFIPEAVKAEIIDRPLTTKIFEFEALQVESLIRQETIKIISSSEIERLANHLGTLANSAFVAMGNPIKIVQYGEMQALATAINLDSDAIVIDERITRLMIENPRIVAEIMRNKLHTHIQINMQNIDEFQQHTRRIRVIRSVELVTIAFEQGMLQKYLPERQDGRRMLLDSILWGVKLKGCSVSPSEIERIMKLEKV